MNCWKRAMPCWSCIDAAYDDFTGRLYSLCPNLSEMELHICWLIKIQLSPKDMAQVVGRRELHPILINLLLIYSDL